MLLAGALLGLNLWLRDVDISGRGGNGYGWPSAFYAWMYRFRHWRFITEALIFDILVWALLFAIIVTIFEGVVRRRAAGKRVYQRSTAYIVALVAVGFLALNLIHPEVNQWDQRWRVNEKGLRQMEILGDVDVLYGFPNYAFRLRTGTRNNIPFSNFEINTEWMLDDAVLALAAMAVAGGITMNGDLRLKSATRAAQRSGDISSGAVP